MALFAFAFLKRQSAREAAARVAYERSRRAGFKEPSTPPYIDPQVCIGCGTCSQACPEGAVLGLVDDRARLIDPSHCIGHGACRATLAQVGRLQLLLESQVKRIEAVQVETKYGMP